MITVIKHGETKFKLTCPVCGCEFEYEREDLQEGEGLYSGEFYIKCPDCGKVVKHKEKPQHIDITWAPGVREIKTGDPYIDPKGGQYRYDPIKNPFGDPWSCEGCSWYEQQKLNPIIGPYIGDTPCTWCPKRQATCTTGKGTVK